MRSPRSGLLRQLFSLVLPVFAVALPTLAPPLPAQISVRTADIPTAHEPIALYTADFNEDGFADLALIDRAADGSTALRVLLNDGHGHFTQTFSRVDSFTSLAIGDLMGNGHVDIGYVIGANPAAGPTGMVVHIEAGLGNGTFVHHEAVIAGPNSFNDRFGFLAAVRLTQGGPLDLVAEDTTTQTLFTFHANPTAAANGSGFHGGFTVHAGIPLPDGAGPIAAVDLDGDGNPELIVNGQSGYAADIFRGSAIGIAAGADPSSRFTGLTGIHSMVLSDLDHDGHPDLIAEGTNGRIDVFAGTGNGSFQSTASVGPGTLDASTGSSGRLISVANRKSDGQIYAILATQAGISEMLMNSEKMWSSNGTFEAEAGGAIYAAADFDGDGNQDVVVAYPNVPAGPNQAAGPAPLSIWFGSEDGKFIASARHPVALATLAKTADLNSVRGHATGLLPTSVALFLCVDPPGTNFPCGNIAATPPPLISPITMFYGQSLDGVAIESVANVTGTLTFLNGSSVFCVLNANTAQGVQTCPPASGYFAAGTSNVTAVYSGDSVYAGSTSNPIVVTVYPDTITANVITSQTPSNLGQPVTFTADVQGNFSVGVGQVVFLDGTTKLGTAPLDPTGHATFTTSSLTAGTHAILVGFPGSQNFSGSTSAPINQVVVPPVPSSFALTVTPTPVTIGVGDSGILLVKIQAVGGFSQPVNLTCTGLPQESRCTFVQPQMPIGGGLTTLQLAVSAPHNCDSNTPYFISSNIEGISSKLALCAVFGGGILLAGFRRRRRLLIGTIFVLLLSLGGLSLLSGCGACTDLGTKPGVYSFTVVATAQNGPNNEVEMQKIPLTVTIP